MEEHIKRVLNSAARKRGGLGALGRVEEHIKRVLNSARYRAPEIRLRMLAAELNACPGLYDALKALPDEEREACGIDHIVARKVILDGNATAAGMNRLLDGDNVKDTVTK